MKTLVTLVLMAALPVLAQTTKKAAPRTSAKPAPRVAQPLVLPKDATPNPDGSYSWTDKAGKKWLFSKTPFGLSRIEDTGASPASAASSSLKVTDLGEKIRFERPSPFGTNRYEKNKADLTDEERAIVAAQQQAPAQPE